MSQSGKTYKFGPFRLDTAECLLLREGERVPLEPQVYRTLAAQRDRTLRPGATSVDKLLLSHVYQELFALAVDLLGGVVAESMNDWTHDLLESRSVSIYGGTTEVQHGIVARQLLGLRDAR